MNRPLNHRLLVLAPSAPPEVCGVSDYAYQTAQALAAFYRSVGVGVDHMPAVPAPMAIAVEPWQQALDRACASSEPTDVLLNYTPRGYAWSGWPTELISTLRRFKKAHPNNQLFVFAHELWSNSRHMRLHHLISNQLARWSIRRICQLASGITVVTEGQKGMLEELLGTTNVRLGTVGANIFPADEEAGLRSHRQPGVWVVFGLAHTRLWTLQAFLPLLKTLHAQGVLRQVHAVGPVGNNYAREEAALGAAELGTGVLVQLGALLPAAVSAVLLSAEAALVWQDADSLRKSGSFAALAAHAVPIVCEAPANLLTPPSRGLFRPAEILDNYGILSGTESEQRRQLLHTWFWSTRSWEAIGRDIRNWIQAPAGWPRAKITATHIS